MNVLRTLTSNYIVNVGVVSWFSAQALKTLFTLIFTKRLVLERMFGSGGMPSSHSALVSSIAIGIANKLGFSSPEFGLAIAFATIVMYDAMGVRRAAGEQAKVLNRIVFEFANLPLLPWLKAKDTDGDGRPDTWERDEDDPDGEAIDTSQIMDKELKEFLGHTPLEVLGGCLVGILVAVFLPVV